MATAARRPQATGISTSGDYSPQEAVAAMTRHGYRMTAPRRAIITAALAYQRPFTAEQLVADSATGAGDSGPDAVPRRGG